MDYKQTILTAMEARKRLEKALADTIRRRELLAGRLAELESKKSALSGELAGLDEKIKLATEAGESVNGLMKNRHSLTLEIADAKRLSSLTRGAMEHSEADVESARLALARELQNAVMRIRDVAASELQKRLDGISANLDAWTDAVFQAANDLGIEAPPSRFEIILSGRRISDALS